MVSTLFPVVALTFKMNIRSNNDGSRRDIFCHHRVCSDDRFITDPDRSENFRSSSEINTVPDSRRSHRTVSVPNGDLMANHDVFTKDRAAGDDDTKGVGDEYRSR